MNENDQTCKSFNQPAPDAPQLPEPLAGLFVERQLYRGLSAEDLREMSKYAEIPNLAGLAAHAMARPAPAGEGRAGGDPVSPQAEEAGKAAGATAEARLTDEVTRALRWGLLHNPCVSAEGTLAGASARPVRVAVIAPQPAAHLAQAFARMLWPVGAGAAGLPVMDYTLFIWPVPLTRKNGSVVLGQFVGHWPERGVGIVIGSDDPALAARLLAAAARGVWAAALPGARVMAEKKDGESWEEVLVDEAGAATPLWGNPLLPAALLARRAQWREAALAVGALPLGVAVDDEGRFPVFEGPLDAGMHASAEEDAGTSAGWVVVPRAALKG